MSQENVEIVRVAFHCFNRRDWEGVGKQLHPDVLQMPLEGWPEPSTHGRTETIAQLKRVREEGLDAEARIEEATSQGDWVLTRLDWVMTGAATGLSHQRTFSAAWRIRNGQITEVRFFWDHGQALEAAGLRE